MSIIKEIEYLASLTSGKQRKFFDQMLRDAHIVKVERMTDVLSASDVQYLKRVIKVKAKECYRNATLIACYMPGIRYVEGKFAPFGFGIEHAWNEYKGHYFDATRELALKEIPDDVEYVALGEYDAPEVMSVCEKREFYGEIYQTRFLQQNKQ